MARFFDHSGSRLTRGIRFLALFVLVGSAAAHADEVLTSTADPYAALASALAIGLAVVGGAFAQAKTAVAALEAIGRNPAAQEKIFVPMIIGLALIESLVLYAFVIALVKIKG